MAISSKHSHYLSSTWSPCGKFIAVVAEEAVEVWDALTLKLISTMQSPTVPIKFTRGIAYSTDNCSLACSSYNAIFIWDTKTGGLVKEIKCRDTHDNSQLLWSFDGNTIGTISATSQREMETSNFTWYDVALGTPLSSETLQSVGSPYFWAYNESFQIGIVTQDPEGCIINIFHVGTTLTKIKSFPLQCNYIPGPFSPTTYRIYLSTFLSNDPEFLILDVCTSRTLLQGKGSYYYSCFSSNGDLFAATTKDYLFIWRYTSSGYIQWMEIQQSPNRPQFSPDLSSLFWHGGAALYLLHLHYSPAPPVAKPTITTPGQSLDAFSPNGTFIATTYKQQSTISITSLNSPNPFPSQFIDTDMSISEIVLTGNVLLVNSAETIVGWLLTEDGVVNGILGNSRADQNDSLWKISPESMHPALLEILQQRQHSNYLEFAIKDEVAVITYMGFIIHTYHIRTGDTIEPANRPQHPIQTWYRFNNPLNQSDCNIYHRQCNKLLECNWPVSPTTLQEGWVKDPEGKHRMWLDPQWGFTGIEVDWLDKATTLRLRKSSELVVIKF